MMGANRRSRRLLSLVVSLTALMGIVVPAHAAQLRVQGSEIQYLAAPGEKNRPQSELQASALGFRSTQTVPLTAGPGCGATTLASGKAGVACELEGITAVRLVLGDGNDEVKPFPLPRISLVVDAGPGDDKVVLLGPGNSLDLTRLTVIGGTGDDTVATPSSIPGTLKGGAGNDALLVYRVPTA